jgi:hypothetical protein
MHAKDRTLLASLGFADPDKGDDLHDLACRYLAQPEHALRLVRMFPAPDSRGWVCADDRGRPRSTDLVEVRAALEVPISKGEGQYRSTIGFADLLVFPSWRHVYLIEKPWTRPLVDSEWVCVCASAGRSCHGARCHYGRTSLGDWRPGSSMMVGIGPAPPSEWRPSGEASEAAKGSPVCVEVKIGRVSVGSLLRQIGLYRQHIEGRWVVASPRGWSSSEKAAIESAGVKAIRLGDAFTRWAEEQRTAARDQHDGEF